MKGTAPKRAHLTKAVGVDDDMAAAVVLLMKQIDQFTSGAPVEVPHGVDMQVSVASLEFNAKIVAHAEFLLSVYI
jgi:hypothetical protein